MVWKQCVCYQQAIVDIERPVAPHVIMKGCVLLLFSELIRSAANGSNECLVLCYSVYSFCGTHYTISARFIVYVIGERTLVYTVCGAYAERAPVEYNVVQVQLSSIPACEQRANIFDRAMILFLLPSFQHQQCVFSKTDCPYTWEIGNMRKAIIWLSKRQ